MIAATMWDDPDFWSIGRAPHMTEGQQDIAQLLWCHLLTCHQPLPGIHLATHEVYAHHFRRQHRVDDFRVALDHLAEIGRIETEPRFRLIRVPKKPKYSRIANGHTLKAWYSEWQRLPECNLRTRHIASIRDALDELIERNRGLGRDSSWTERAWAETFGSVIVSDHHTQLQLVPDLFTGSDPDPIRDPIDLSLSLTRERSNTHTSEREPTGIGSGSDPDRIPRRAPRPSSRASLLAAHREQAEKLWALQNVLRQQSIEGARTLGSTEEALLSVAKILAAGHTVDDCEHVLRVYAAEVKRTGESKWFNGTTNWSLDNFRRALGKRVDDGIKQGRVEPTPHRAFSGGYKQL